MHGQDQHVLFGMLILSIFAPRREFSSSRRSAVSSMASRGIVFLQNDSKEFFDPLVLSVEIEPPEQRLQPGGGVVLGLRRGAGRGMAVRVAPAAVYGLLLARKMRADLFRRARLRRGGYISDGLPVQLTGGQFPERQNLPPGSDLDTASPMWAIASARSWRALHRPKAIIDVPSAEKSSFSAPLSLLHRRAAGHAHLLPLLTGDKKLAGLEPSNGPTMPVSSIWSTRRSAGIAELQPALEHGDGRLLRIENNVHRLRQQTNCR